MPISTYLANVAGKDAKSGASKTEDKPKRESAEEKSKITAGQSAFQSKCTTCHDADRSLQTNKSLAEWRSTVQRMAGKPGASIGSDDVESISMYLADRGEAGGEGAGKGKEGGSSISTFATISPLWRSGSSQIQKMDSFPKRFSVPLGKEKMGLVRRVTACTSCHGNGEPVFEPR
jgi:cytochrome c553